MTRKASSATDGQEGDDSAAKTSEVSSTSKEEPGVFGKCFAAIRDGNDDTLKKHVSTRLSSILVKHGLSEYVTVILFDDIDSISDFHADRLYAAAAPFRGSGEDVLLLIHSKGGSVEPAYLTSKTLKRVSNKKFVVAVPRRAKSAATLIALGADEIHMGMNSQLGPIDPQFGGIPALALGNALDVIADLACRFPGTTDLLTKYLTDQIPIRILGYYQRISESAIQYAERLLVGKSLASNHTPESVSKHLVNHYKDHGFVIDLEEATSLLGEAMIKEGTPEYKASDEIFQFLETIDFLLSMHDKQYFYVGTIEDGLYIKSKPTNQ